MAATLPPPGACFPARRNLSSTCRPGSILNPYRLPHFSADLFERLPAQAATAELAAIAARAYGAPAAAHVVPAPGTQILLPLVAGLLRPGRAAVISPAYGELADAAALAGHKVVAVSDLAAAGDARLVFVGNPNNPNGRLFAASDLIRLAKDLRARGGMLIVDEAFMDVGPIGTSLAPELGRNRSNIIVLRSFGKFFGLAGINSASHWPHHRLRRASPQCSDHGQCPDRRWPRARKRWPTRPGSSERATVSPSRPRGSMPW